MGILNFFKRFRKTAEVSPVTSSLPVSPKVVENHKLSARKGDARAHKREVDLRIADRLKERFFAFDVETTGIDPHSDRVIELGVVEFIGGSPSRRFVTLVDPGRPIPASATAVNHITDAMVSGAPSESEAFHKLLDFLGDALHGETILCAHNARFDMDFLCNTLSRLGYDAELSYVDTLAFSRRQLKGLENYRQSTILSHLGISCQNSHRACDDAESCGRILVCLLDKKKEELDQERERLEALIPKGDELEVCAVIQSALEKAGFDLSYLRFKAYRNSVAACCFGSFLVIKTTKKGKYVIVSRVASEKTGLLTESCPVSEGGADWNRVYFTDPFKLEPLYEFFCEQYRKDYKELMEYMDYDDSFRKNVKRWLLEGKQIKPDELRGLLDSARGRVYEEPDVEVKKRVKREDVTICAVNDRCPLSEIRNLDDRDAGFREGSPYYWQGEEKRKADQFEEALRLFDLARYHGYEAPALYESYVKVYRKMKDYDNEIVIIDEFLSRETYGRDGEYIARRDSALDLLFKKQEAERIKAQKAIEKEEKKKEREAQKTNAEPRKPLGRPILQLDDEGVVIKEYESISAAVKEVGVNSKSIRDAANGMQKHAGGYCWKFKDEVQTGEPSLRL